MADDVRLAPFATATVTVAAACSALVVTAVAIAIVAVLRDQVAALTGLALLLGQYGAITGACLVVLDPSTARVPRALLAVRRGDVRPALLGWLTAVGAAALLVTGLRSVGIPVTGNNPLTGGPVLPHSALQAVIALLLLLAVFGIAVPVIEELLFRAIVLPALVTGLGPFPGIVAQGLLFALFHVDPGAGVANVGVVAALTPFGIVAGVLAHRSGRLGPSIATHALHNTVALTLALRH